MAKLTLAFKDKKLKIFPIVAAELVVGRDPDCAIHIDSLAVQPLHARIFATGNHYRVESMQSEEPVLINHQVINEATLLQDGDLIQVGKHTLSFSSEPVLEGVQANHAPAAPRPLQGWLQIMSGSHLGRSIRLDRAMIRLGKTGKECAIISRRDDGYHIAHLQGDTTPRVNDESIGDRSCTLHNGDRIQIGRLELHFYTEGEQSATTETAPMQEEQRRFTRIAFDAAATLIKDGREWPCELIDLSLKGALVSQPDDWNGAIDDTCKLRLTLDDDVRIDMDVAIAHHENQRVGLCCKDIDLDSITHLRRLVELNLGDAILLERELMALG